MNIILHILAALWLATSILPAQAQAQGALMAITRGERAEDVAVPQASEQDIQELVRLLSNPELVAQLKQRLPQAADAGAADDYSASNLRVYFQEKLIYAELRGRSIVNALTTVPELSKALSMAWNESMAASDFLQSAIYVVIFLKAYPSGSGRINGWWPRCYARSGATRLRPRQSALSRPTTRSPTDNCVAPSYCVTGCRGISLSFYSAGLAWNGFTGVTCRQC